MLSSINVTVPPMPPGIIQSQLANYITITDVPALLAAKGQVPSYYEDTMLHLKRNFPKAYLGGGWLRRLLLGMEQSSDIDLFFRSPGDFIEALEYFESRVSAKLVHANPQNTTYEYDGKIYQLICVRFYDNPVDVIDSFDFTLTQFVVELSAGPVVIHTTAQALADTYARRLVLHRMTYPHATLRRLVKYAKQGFTLCNGTIDSIYRSVVEDPRLLGEQLQYLD